MEFARAAIDEYRRFCFLAAASKEGPVTPSEEVDEVWHLHLTYSRDYWERWCPNVLGMSLHHGPTEGGPAEDRRYVEQYARTLERYERFFGPADERFWPGTAQRFQGLPRFRVVDRDRSIVLPKSGPILKGIRRFLRGASPTGKPALRPDLPR